MLPINYISGGVKWPKGPVVFTSHLEKVFHSKTIGIHILVDLGKLSLPI